MKIFSTSELYDRAVTTYIETDNNKKTRSKFWAEQTKGLEQSGIKRTGIKKHKNEFNRLSNGEKVGKNTNQLNKGKFNVNVQWSKSLTLTKIYQVHDSNKPSHGSENGRTHFTRVKLDKWPGRNCGCEVVLLHYPWSFPTQSPKGPGAGLGPRIGPRLGAINGAPE